MKRRTFLTHAVLGAALALVATAVPARAQNAKPFLGAWNITGQGTDAAIIYWLDVKEDGGKLSGLFLNRTGHPLPLPVIKIQGDELVFQAGGTPEKPTGPEFHAKIEGGKLVGHHTVTVGGRRGGSADPNAPAPAPTTLEVTWIGVRPPTFPPSNANGKHDFAAPVVLFDAATKSRPLDSVFTVQNTNRPMGWKVDADGLLANDAPGGNNIISKEKFTNFRVEMEYKLEPGSNSGLYLRGRYEIQVLDDLTDTTTEGFLKQAAIYGRSAPSQLASKAPGEWQTIDATIVGNKVTVHLNGKLVQDNVTVGGVTGGTLDNDELAPGPVMVQGDHGHIWVRKLVVTPIK